MKKAAIAVFVIVVATSLVAMAAGPRTAERVKPAPNMTVPLQPQPDSLVLFGGVRYDNGTPAGLYPSGNGRCYGNVFNTENGRPLIPGTLTGFVWANAFPGGATAGTMCLSAFDVNPALTTATWLGWWCFGGVPASTLVGFGGAAQGVDGDFMVGVYAGTTGFRPASGFFSVGSVNGQGFHAADAVWNTTTLNLNAGQNAVVRAFGNILVPIELLDLASE